MVNSGEGQKLIKKKYDPPLSVLIGGKPFSRYLLGSNRKHTIFFRIGLFDFYSIMRAWLLDFWLNLVLLWTRIERSIVSIFVPIRPYIKCNFCNYWPSSLQRVAGLPKGLQSILLLPSCTWTLNSFYQFFSHKCIEINLCKTTLNCIVLFK